jgi:hypothetical protein
MMKMITRIRSNDLDSGIKLTLIIPIGLTRGIANENMGLGLFDANMIMTAHGYLWIFQNGSEIQAFRTWIKLNQ